MLDQINLDKDKLTVIMQTGKHPNKQFEHGCQIQARNRNNEYKISDRDMISRIVNGLQDPYTGFYTKIIVEQKMEKDSYKVLEALQEMGSKIWTLAQGNKDEKETSMYSVGTSAFTK